MFSLTAKCVKHVACCNKVSTRALVITNYVKKGSNTSERCYPINLDFIRMNSSTALTGANASPDNNNSDEQAPVVDFKTITNGDPELEHKLKVLMLETEVLRQEGRLVPPNSFMTTERWRELINLESRTGRRKYLEFLFKNSKRRENSKAKKIDKKESYEVTVEEVRQKRLNEPRDEESHALKYGLLYNNIFIRFYESTMNNMYNNRLIQAMQFGQKLVIDCGYGANMTKRENANCAKQLMLLFSENRFNDEPFDLHFCNWPRGTDMERTLRTFIPTLYDRAFPFNAHEGSYLDMFDTNQLVYLTPHCRDEMKDFDHDAVYIIGAIVDKVNNEPLSLAKAKREGIRMQKFPLDRYLQWGAGSGKSLTLNHCVSILLDMKRTNDWAYALRHVPRRKLADVTASDTTRGFSDKLRYDSAEKERGIRKKWTPLSQIDFEKLGMYRKKKQSDTG